MSFFRGKVPEKSFMSQSQTMAAAAAAAVAAAAIWLCHMALPYPRFWSKTEKVRSFKKKWDLFQLPNIGLVTHDDLLKISIWPRVEKHVPSTPRGSRYDFYGQLDQNLWPSWWKSGKNVKLCQNELQKNYFWLLRSSPGSVFHFKSI